MEHEKDWIEALRTYYPNTLLSDEDLLKIAEFVKEQHGTNGLSPDNESLRMLVIWEEERQI